MSTSYSGNKGKGRQGRGASFDALFSDLFQQPTVDEDRNHVAHNPIDAGEGDMTALLRELAGSSRCTQEDITKVLTQGPTTPELDVDTTMDQLEKLYTTGLLLGMGGRK
ncbi:hypothetical protein NMY22_g7917 [Coprinellus aureogranulatus]|nr:hypothetical protein NMY22_g7917 [Coprinellus aureogranulatus]